MFALTIHVDDHGPFVATGERGDIVATLSTTSDGWLRLRVTVGADQSGDAHVVERLGPGHRIRFQFDILGPDACESSIERLPTAGALGSPAALRDGHRLGLDVHHPRHEGTRLSHPDDGGFTLMLGALPRDHARVFVMAGNDHEAWQWQLPDLYSGDAIAFDVVETTWTSPYPNVQIHPDAAAEILVHRLAQRLLPIAEGVEWFEGLSAAEQRGVLSALVSFASDAAAEESDADAALESSGLPAELAPGVALGTGSIFARLSKLMQLPKEENTRVFRLLIKVLALADARRRVECGAGCPHWWHRDLSDPDVVADLERTD